ncbi:MAG: NADH-quinone oxidoreductase subunit C [Aggregatilineales bacterium]
MNIPESLDPVDAIKVNLPDALQDVVEFRGETTLVVASKDIPEVIRFLRDTPGLSYNFLSDISAVDYYPEYTRPGRFGVSYHIYSMLYNHRLRVKTYVEEDDTVVPSITSLWPAANWFEREIFDMMGIEFEGHPNLRRILMPTDWNGHPHRRDYPLGYETIQFSFNVDEILKHKPFAED